MSKTIMQNISPEIAAERAAMVAVNGEVEWMGQNPRQSIATTEEKREAWKAFFKSKSKKARDVYVIFAIFACYLVLDWQLATDWEWFSNSFLAWMLQAAVFLGMLVNLLTINFGVFHGIVKDGSPLSVALSPLNLYKAIRCAKHPLFPTGWKYAMYAAQIGMLFVLGYCIVETILYVIYCFS